MAQLKQMQAAGRINMSESDISMDSVHLANCRDKVTQTEAIFLPPPCVTTEQHYSSVLASQFEDSKHISPQRSVRGALIESHSLGLLFMEYSLRYIAQRPNSEPRVSSRVLLSSFFLQLYQLNSLAQFKLNKYLESLDFYAKVCSD